MDEEAGEQDDGLNENPPAGEEEKDLDTLYLERLNKDNQIRMAIQVLKSWSVIQQIKTGETTGNI